MEKLYKACKGIPQGAANASSADRPSQNVPVGRQDGGTATPVIQPVLQAASTNASNESSNDYKGWNTQDGGYKGWGSSSGGKVAEKHGNEASHGGWEAEPSTFNGWSSSSEAGPSTGQSGPSKKQTTEASLIQPSAPPLPEGTFEYPSLTTDAGGGHGAGADMATDEKPGSTCVICWDAPAEGACVPCGHLAGCMDCLSEVKAKKWGCPVCREQIQQVVKVYAV